jgi:hypothetical protein
MSKGKGKRKKHIYRFRPPRQYQSHNWKAARNAHTRITNTEHLNQPPNPTIESNLGFFAKAFQSIFYYPVSSPAGKLSWFLVDSLTIWLIIGYGIGRTYFDFPDITSVPKSILEFSGTLLIMGGTIHFIMLVRLIWRRNYLTESFLKLFAVQNTYGSILSTIGIVMVLIYSYGIADSFAHFLQTRSPALGQSFIKFFSFVYSFLLSVTSSVVGSAIYAYIIRYRRRAKMRRGKE